MISLLRSRGIHPSQGFLKPTIILATLALAGFLGWSTNPTIIFLFATGTVALIVLSILIRQPAWGLLGLIVLSLTAKITIQTGTNVPLNLTILATIFLIGLWVARMLFLRDVRLVPSRTMLPALAFVLATTISLIAGNISWIVHVPGRASFPAQLGGWLLYVLSIGIFVWFANQVRDIVWLRRTTWLFLALGGVFIMLRILNLASLREMLFVSGRSLGSVFWIWLAALAYGQALLNDKLHRFVRLSLGLLVMMTFYVAMVIAFDWNSGWMPGMLALGVISWLASPRMRVAVIIFGLLALILFFPAIYDWYSGTMSHYTVYSRQATYPIMYELFKANPVFGLGPSNYYHYTPLFPILGWYVRFNSHNNYIDIVVQTGLLGLGMFSWFVYELARLGWWLRHKVTDGFARAYVITCLGGLAGMLFSGFLGDWFMPFTYNIGMSGFRASSLGWLFLGGLVVIEQAVVNKEETQDESGFQHTG